MVAKAEVWHLVHVYLEVPDDPTSLLYETMHPTTCPVRWSSHRGVEHECLLASQVDAAGWELFFPTGPVYPPPVGWWWVHCEVVKLRGADWVEWDVEAVVVPAVVPEEVRGA
jgi:hypothetical protein